MLWPALRPKSTLSDFNSSRVQNMDVMDMPEVSDENPFIHGMSKQFVNALRELFDIMDGMGSGCVRFTDIATQWEEDDNDPYFPKGLINCLSKVTLPNGLLTFDRFCAGIKLCLLKNQVDLSNDDNNNGVGRPSSPASALSAPPPLLPSPSSLEGTPRPGSVPSIPPPVPPHQSPPALAKPIPQSYHSLHKMPTSVSSLPGLESAHQQKPTASVSPVPPLSIHRNGTNSDYNSSDSSSTQNYQRAKSMPQLMIKTNGNSEMRHIQSDARLTSREVDVHKGRQIRSPIQSAKALSKTCNKNIMKTLQNWRDNVLGRQAIEMEKNSSSGSKENILVPNDADHLTLSRGHQQLVPFMPPPQLIGQPNGPAMRRTANKRREPRRHTVGSNGIDFYSVGIDRNPIEIFLMMIIVSSDPANPAVGTGKKSIPSGSGRHRQSEGLVFAPNCQNSRQDQLRD